MKLVQLFGFITKKFLMTHGHMNVKNRNFYQDPNGISAIRPIKRKLEHIFLEVKIRDILLLLLCFRG